MMWQMRQRPSPHHHPLTRTKNNNHHGGGGSRSVVAGLFLLLLFLTSLVALLSLKSNMDDSMLVTTTVTRASLVESSIMELPLPTMEVTKKATTTITPHHTKALPSTSELGNIKGTSRNTPAINNLKDDASRHTITTDKPPPPPPGDDATHPKKSTTTTSIIRPSSKSQPRHHAQNDKFVVGVMFADQPRYIDSLLAQAETWMKEFPPERVFCVGPFDKLKERHAKQQHILFPRGIASPCPDRELYCKRMKQIAEAHRLLKSGIDFDWFLSGNEDWYVNVDAMKKALQHKDPNQPVVYSGLGCAQEWRYHRDSKNGTLPAPSYWPRPTGCGKLRKHGGLCLGVGAVISRAAIQIFMEHGEEQLFALTRAQPFPWEHHPQDDPVLSCVVYALEEERGLRLEREPWRGVSGVSGVERVDATVGTVHAVPSESVSAADIIRKAHAILTKQS